LVELEQLCRLDHRAKFRDPAPAHEQCAQTEHQATAGGEIRSAMAAAIADQKLMFEQRGFCSDGMYTTWEEQLSDPVGESRRWADRA
jgi:hypothetical protein